MKTNQILLFSLFALSALAVTGCDEMFAEKEPSDCTIKASAVQEPIVTRVSVSDENAQSYWQADDSLSVCVSTSGTGRFKPFSLVGDGGTVVSEFHGNVAESSIKDCAVYPCGLSPRFDGGQLYITLPSVIRYEKSSSRAPMYASAEDFSQYGIFYFKKVGGILRLKLNNVPDSTAFISLRTPGRKICGELPVSRDTDPPCISTEETPDGVCDAIRMDVASAKKDKAVEAIFPLPSGDYPKMEIVAMDASGDTLASYVTARKVSITRGEMRFENTSKMASGEDSGAHYVKVTAEKASWEGEYLLVYENGTSAVVMRTDSKFADKEAVGISIQMDETGIPAVEETSAGIVTIRKHKADATGVGGTTDQAGKYTLFLQNGNGFGRYSWTEFSFNNNANAGRFVYTINYDSAAGCMEMVCKSKSNGDVRIKYNTSNGHFGMGTVAETPAPTYADVQLYELK